MCAQSGRSSYRPHTGGVIVTIVRINGAGPLSVKEARELFSQNAASYLEVPGLISKSYLLSDDGQDTGGVYLWTDRESAEAKFNPGWFEGVTAKYGSPPVVEYFDAPVVVDVEKRVVRTDRP